MNTLSFISDQTKPLYLQEVITGVIIILVLITLIFLVAWPSLKANNIFKKERIYKYGKGEHAKIYVRARERDTLVFAIAANIIGVVLLSCLAVQIKTQGANYHVTNVDRLPLRFFGLSLFCTCALFVYARFGDLELDLIRNFKYSLKVWLTGVFLSPVVLLAIYSSKILSGGWLFYLYFKTAVMINGIGFLSFLMLVFGVHYFTAKPLKAMAKRRYVLLTTQATLLLNIIGASLIVSPGASWFIGWLVCSGIMALGTRYYAMDTTVYSEITYYEAEIID
jgi:hypothetical protein